MPMGEGSRGGQVIGHNRSGAPIYASHLSKIGQAAHARVIPAGRPQIGPLVVTHDRHGNRVALGGAYAHPTQMARFKKTLAQLS